MHILIFKNITWRYLFSPSSLLPFPQVLVQLNWKYSLWLSRSTFFLSFFGGGVWRSCPSCMISFYWFVLMCWLWFLAFFCTMLACWRLSAVLIHRTAPAHSSIGSPPNYFTVCCQSNVTHQPSYWPSALVGRSVRLWCIKISFLYSFSKSFSKFSLRSMTPHPDWGDKNIIGRAQWWRMWFGFFGHRLFIPKV